ncbi:MAG: hypothetical protein JOZ39_02340, partial [Chloroflexi bacterium]|nr:hypothetical protein [Chloroflexota bacterium]
MEKVRKRLDAWIGRHPTLTFTCLATLFVALPADRLSWAPGLPLDFRIAGPALLVVGLAGLLGRPRRWQIGALAALCFLKALTLPLTVQHGLIGEYYDNPTFHGPPAQVELDQHIAFADDSFPLGFFNDQKYDFRGSSVDRNQLPFSVRWTGVIRGQPALTAQGAATLDGGVLTFSKGWTPHAGVQLTGAQLYPRPYSDLRLALGTVALGVQDGLALLFAVVVLAGIAGVRVGPGSIAFLLFAAQGYLHAWPMANSTPM